MKKSLYTTAICGSLLGLALALPAQAQTYRDGTPAIGAQSSTPYARTYVVIEQPVTAEPESATSRDNEGRPTRGAPGTGDIDEVAMTREDSYSSPPQRRGAY